MMSGESCIFIFIDMAIEMGNEAHSDDRREGLGTKD